MWKDGKWQQISTKKLQLVDEYNAGMPGVDKLNQLTGLYNVLQKCARWWKTVFFSFFHSVDIACAL